MNPLVERRAKVTVKVVRPSDKPDEGDQEITYAFEQHRMSIQVSQGGGQFGNAKVAIYGVPLATMNKIARLWLEVLSPGNSDSMAIDVWDGANFVPFFNGVITWSAINATGSPQVALEIEANSSMVAMNTVAAPYSQGTPIALKDALTAILGPTGLVIDFADSVPDFRPQMIHVIGTPMQQAITLMGYYPELTWYINLQRFIVRPVNGPVGGDALLINTSNGLIGYPTYATSGISFAMLFDARLRLGLALDIQTAYDYVNRTKWLASVLQHNIQPNWPGGQWVSQVVAQPYGSKGNTDGSAT